ncbi:MULTISPECIES: RNA-binding domain-containing protein [unclassified Amycolatopsis]|uniref:AlbA family DNA-binding domain-containing protein n=1 Tax=unclassified Amycolatopsis TaxID=2618356 RepID=UPI00287594DE|nr:MULTISPECIES: RNA-binding domain-containing protein [unclassified Amycolatopsis]MDS0139930.1 putative DNA binding domain-containing protein [Amycolatopsis sp. 505]MDS0148158.1 putative DNA binding domain-containing protein [Amycolatopsis sp. CM201R]
MDQPFACDGRVDAEKLSELLAVQTETDALDYKTFLDLSQNKDRVEFAKDVGAMQSLPDGGYIVIGADGQGNPAKGSPEFTVDDFDEQKVRSAVKKFLDEPFTVRSAVHEIDGKNLAVIYIGPNEQGFAIFAKDGQFTNSAGKNDHAFRAGDVYCRHGTSSERWRQSDLPSIFSRLQSRIREEERKQLGDAFQAFEQGIRGAEIQSSPIGALSWQLSVEDFDSAIIAAMRASDQISLKALLISIASQARSLLSATEPDYDTLDVLLDRLTSVTAAAITYDYRSLFASSKETLEKIYWSVADEYGYPAGDLANIAPKLWFSIGIRVEALGALAIRMRSWWAIPQLIATPTRRSGYFTWIRHSLTAAANANLLKGSGGGFIPGAFISFARQVSAQVPALHPDIPNSAINEFEVGVAPQPRDELLDSIVQFDLTWCIFAYAHTKKTSDFYPSFSGFFAHRAAPVVNAILSKDTRKEILPDVSEDDLRASMKRVFEYANNESWQSHRGDWELDWPQLDSFLEGSSGSS